MSEQLELIPTEPKLTDRQAVVLHALQAAGPDGLTADEAGAVAHETRDSIWAHPRHERCQFCLSAGTEILRALHAKGLARYRRANRAREIPGAWLAMGAADEPETASGMLHDDQPLPF